MKFGKRKKEKGIDTVLPLKRLILRKEILENP